MPHRPGRNGPRLETEMSHDVNIIVGTTPTGTRPEFRIVCDKCGTIDKSGSMREAISVAEWHHDYPHRSRMNGGTK